MTEIPNSKRPPLSGRSTLSSRPKGSRLIRLQLKDSAQVKIFGHWKLKFVICLYFGTCNLLFFTGFGALNVYSPIILTGAPLLCHFNNNQRDIVCRFQVLPETLQFQYDAVQDFPGTHI